MIISRKRYHEEINKAVVEALDKQSHARYIDDRIENVYRDCQRSIIDLERRMYTLEHKTGYVWVDEATVAKAPIG